MSHAADGQKSHLRVRRRAADSSRYGYWPWTAKVGFYILTRICTASIVLHKAAEPEAEFWWHQRQTSPANGAATERREVLLFFDCAPPTVLNSTEPPPLE